MNKAVAMMLAMLAKVAHAGVLASTAATRVSQLLASDVKEARCSQQRVYAGARVAAVMSVAAPSAQAAVWAALKPHVADIVSAISRPSDFKRQKKEYAARQAHSPAVAAAMLALWPLPAPAMPSALAMLQSHHPDVARSAAYTLQVGACGSLAARAAMAEQCAHPLAAKISTFYNMVSHYRRERGIAQAACAGDGDLTITLAASTLRTAHVPKSWLKVPDAKGAGAMQSAGVAGSEAAGALLHGSGTTLRRLLAAVGTAIPRSGWQAAVGGGEQVAALRQALHASPARPAPELHISTLYGAQLAVFPTVDCAAQARASQLCGADQVPCHPSQHAAASESTQALLAAAMVDERWSVRLGAVQELLAAGSDMVWHAECPDCVAPAAAGMSLPMLAQPGHDQASVWSFLCQLPPLPHDSWFTAGGLLPEQLPAPVQATAGLQASLAAVPGVVLLVTHVICHGLAHAAAMFGAPAAGQGPTRDRAQQVLLGWASQCTPAQTRQRNAMLAQVAGLAATFGQWVDVVLAGALQPDLAVACERVACLRTAAADDSDAPQTDQPAINLILGLSVLSGAVSRWCLALCCAPWAQPGTACGTAAACSHARYQLARAAASTCPALAWTGGTAAADLVEPLASSCLPMDAPMSHSAVEAAWRIQQADTIQRVASPVWQQFMRACRAIAVPVLGAVGLQGPAEARDHILAGLCGGCQPMLVSRLAVVPALLSVWAAAGCLPDLHAMAAAWASCEAAAAASASVAAALHALSIASLVCAEPTSTRIPGALPLGAVEPAGLEYTALFQRAAMTPAGVYAFVGTATAAGMVTSTQSAWLDALAAVDAGSAWHALPGVQPIATAAMLAALNRGLAASSGSPAAAGHVVDDVFGMLGHTGGGDATPATPGTTFASTPAPEDDLLGLFSGTPSAATRASATPTPAGGAADLLDLFGGLDFTQGSSPAKPPAATSPAGHGPEQPQQHAAMPAHAGAVVQHDAGPSVSGPAVLWAWMSQHASTLLSSPA